ncbi:MAG: DUF1501 domain-containing protein [Verrucomicrobiales bacterium]|jgi:hypothetical protein|nr:DUF1501 domain-containing protein [Verrucomicrobiales bacterium]MDP4793418.1 DUF1501 domain-containing protein [Verrucomicrobiales bacterium]MDP4938540.1 DUF1501 domain-containing protein [Verrucomicrobiales bacterium]MDP5004235.1 DUF1501 domain-containing protein [Verrucomicrobiales bacterium]
MKDQLNKLDQLSRRQFVARAAKTALGVSILPIGGANRLLAAGGGKAEHCIFFYMSGGMTHMETFDPKPGTETGGKTKGISTGVAGVELAEFMPQLAQRFSDIAVVRSMTQKTGDHRGGAYWMRTSYEPRATIIHPSMGPWAQTLLGKKHDTLPDSVVIGGGGEHPGAGFFGPALAPLPIGDPDKGVQNSAPYNGVSEDLFEKRLDLMNTFDDSFRRKFQTDEVKAYTQFYEETLKLMKSEDLATFDLSLEEKYEEKAARYGNTRVGKGAMLAKRLVSSGVRFVEVVSGGWDMHNDLWNAIPTTGGQLDQALGSLIDDLKAEGLFEKTLIVVGTEFGRTPIINANGGRDHHPRVFSTMFAGGGIQGGQVYGASDDKGIAVKENPVVAKDFNATIAHAMGLDLNKVIYAPSGRPFLVAGHTRDPKTDGIVTEGHPIMELFS